MKFDVDYDKVLPTEDKENEFEQMILSEYSNIWPDVRMKSGGIGRGKDLQSNLCYTILSQRQSRTF